MTDSLNKRTHKAPESWMKNRKGVISVWLVGAGGNGGEVMDILAQFDTAMLALGGKPLAVTVFDDGIVREPNLVRQRFWPCDLGNNKAVVLANRYNMMMGADWQAYPDRLENIITDNKQRRELPRPDIIITAVDVVSTRRWMADDFCSMVGESAEDIVWLDLGNKARTGQAVLGRLDGSIPHVVSHFPDIEHMEDDTRKSCSTADAIATQDCLINRTISTAGMAMFWELLRNGETHKNGVMVDLASGRHLPIPIPEWAELDDDSDDDMEWDARDIG